MAAGKIELLELDAVLSYPMVLVSCTRLSVLGRHGWIRRGCSLVIELDATIADLGEGSRRAGIAASGEDGLNASAETGGLFFMRNVNVCATRVG
jgi:hypothetical protein